MRPLVILLSVISSLLPVSAQTPDQFERVLVPVAATWLEGSFGSVWNTDTYVLNSGASPRIVDQTPDQECRLLCPSPVIGAKTFRPVSIDLPPGNHGVFLYLEKPSDPITLSLRVTEESDGWGFTVPVPRACDFDTTIQLLNLPLDSRFRSRIRVYDFEGASSVDVVLRVFSEGEYRLIGSGDLTLTHNTTERQSEAFPAYPADGSVMLASLLHDVDESDERAWVEVLSTVPIWAFASVTDNATQRTTVISPDGGCAR